MGTFAFFHLKKGSCLKHTGYRERSRSGKFPSTISLMLLHHHAERGCHAMRTMKKNAISLDQTILRLVIQHQVPDQASLLEHLAAEGFRITQGTLSRRLQKLTVQKRDGRYQRVVPMDHPLPAYNLIESPPNLLILQTGPGFGMALAVRVDRSNIQGIAGSIAGEDTLLIALERGHSLGEVRQRLEQVLGPPR
jgi:transcriptional regulator of arginine metabolism